MIAFRLASDAEEFIELAKFRALRILWARVEEACGLSPRAARVQAESAWRTMTRLDPYVNVMRGSIAAFSAGLGGADSVSVLPHPLAIGLPGGLARRLARNGQLVLLRESHLGFVEDPAAGAGGFEALTKALNEKAWASVSGDRGRGRPSGRARERELPAQGRRKPGGAEARRREDQGADHRRQRASETRRSPGRSRDRRARSGALRRLRRRA